MIKYKGIKHNSIRDLCDKFNVTEGQYKREYAKSRNVTRTIQKCLDINNKVITETLANNDGDDIVNYGSMKKTLKELAESLEIDYKTLIKNLDKMELVNAIKNCKEDKFKQSKEYAKMLEEYIIEHGSKYNLDKDVPKTISRLLQRARKIKLLVDMHIKHVNNIERINSLLPKIEYSDEIIKHLLEINRHYESTPMFAEILCQSLELIQQQGNKGAEYTKIKERMARKEEQRINEEQEQRLNREKQRMHKEEQKLSEKEETRLAREKQRYDEVDLKRQSSSIQDLLIELGPKYAHKIITEHKDLYRQSKESSSATDLFKNICREELKVKSKNMYLEKKQKDKELLNMTEEEIQAKKEKKCMRLERQAQKKQKKLTDYM